jgi:hypothetical protein
MNLSWEVGNRTFLTSLLAAGLLGFAAFNTFYPIVPAQWEAIILKAGTALLGLMGYYLRDAIKRVDDKLNSIQAALPSAEKKN